MSGHSKWHNIKLKKGKVDAQRGALFTKLSKEITLAVKNGSPDPDANYRLKMAVEKAREHNVPADNIKRAIVRASGADGAKDIEEIRYEGYGPAGVALIVDVATDNRNRTASEMRFLFSRHGGTLGETGSVGWMFEPRGLVEVENASLDEDALTEAALVDGVVDLRYDEGSQEGRSIVSTQTAALAAVREALVAKGLRVTSMILGVEPKGHVVPHDGVREIVAFLDALEEHEDVQRVYSNVELDARATRSARLDDVVRRRATMGRARVTGGALRVPAARAPRAELPLVRQDWYLRVRARALRRGRQCGSREQIQDFRDPVCNKDIARADARRTNALGCAVDGASART